MTALLAGAISLMTVWLICGVMVAAWMRSSVAWWVMVSREFDWIATVVAVLFGVAILAMVIAEDIHERRR